MFVLLLPFGALIMDVGTTFYVLLCIHIMQDKQILAFVLFFYLGLEELSMPVHFTCSVCGYNLLNELALHSDV